MAFSPDFLEEIRSRLPLPPVIGRKVKLLRAGRDFIGCCPFHHEKSPSFHVYADHYHCFGCGAHGDIIDFILKTEGRNFPDTVEELAKEAGLSLPEKRTEAPEAISHRQKLYEVLQRAAFIYARLLKEPQGAKALAYLKNRGLSEQRITELGLGYGGQARGVVAALLTKEGFSTDLLCAAGILRKNDYNTPADLFWDRVIFPIKDRKGQVISFGGRILGDGQPKYINGPETEVFLKRHSLYGLDTAEKAVRQGASLTVVEGYTDVISMQNAGFGGAVAPLGTALTEEQLSKLWRFSAEITFCFDGDKAGERATLRALSLILPSLKPDKVVKVILLPEQDDPDSFLRKNGKNGMEEAFRQALPLSEAFFLLTYRRFSPTTPESFALLRHELEAAAASVTDFALSSEYRRVWREKFFAGRPKSDNFRQQAFAGHRRFSGQVSTHHLVKAALPPAYSEEKTIRLRIILLFTLLFVYPALLSETEEKVAELSLPADFEPLRAEILSFSVEAEDTGPKALQQYFISAGLDEKLIALAGTDVLAKERQSNRSFTEARLLWQQTYAFLHRSFLEAEKKEAEKLFKEEPTAPHQNRLIAAAQALAGLGDFPEGEFFGE